MSSDRPPLYSPAAGNGSRRSLPHRVRLLCISLDEPPWPLLALRLDAAGCDEAEFDWQSSSSGALAALRKHTFDVIVIRDEPATSRPESSTRGLVEAIRASGTDDPIAVILAQPDDDRLLQLDQFDCEVLVSAHGWQSRALVATIRRSVTRGDIRRDVAALESAARRGRVRERDEAEAHLQQLRTLVQRRLGLGAEHLEGDSSAAGRDGPCTSTRVGRYYRELLRTYVMMGSGNLGHELRKLAEILSLSGTSLPDTVSLHVDQVESLICGLGSRSSRHIMARADLLALELLIHLGESYRSKSRFRGLGDNGVDLLHAEALLQGEVDPTD